MLNRLRRSIGTEEIVLIVVALSLSFWLMFHTFSYAGGAMYIAAKAWSDFSGNIPLIRSFSLGDNFPPQYPLFPGEPIRYHFLFYFLAGILEKIGVRIDYALNIPSALSFAALIFVIYLLAKTLFKNKTVGLLSVIFFLFNGSFSFLEFFKTHPLAVTSLRDIVTNTTFPSFGPYDGKIVSAFWNLNIYTNQRHLALPIVFLLTVIVTLVIFERKKRRIPRIVVLLFGVLVGLLPLSHSSIFIMSGAVLAILFLLLPKQRLPLFFLLLLAGVLALPRVIFLGQTATFKPLVNFHYLIGPNPTVQTFITYWLANLGLFFFMIPTGFFLAPPIAKKIFISVFVLFLIGHTIQFSQEIASNHKFFNLFLIIGNMFAAYGLIRIWRTHLLGKMIAPLLLFFMILSGIIDFFPIYNDSKISLADYPKNQDVRWILENTPKDAVFLNTTYLYHPASIAGRKIFLGWPYFAWSLGHDTNKRDILRKSLLASGDIAAFCTSIRGYKIDYVTIERQDSTDGFKANRAFFEQNFSKVYDDTRTEFTIYATAQAC